MISKPIHAHPKTSVRLLTRSPSPSMTNALQLAPKLYHFSRDAIHALFRSLGYPSNTPVWMPSYHCGMEVRAAADAGLTPHFYRLNKDLSVDVDDLAAGLRQQPGPVLLIHYFGFPQPDILSIASLCRQHGVPLIEDCSHAFLSRLGGRELGTFGPAATFSLYKTLGTSDGGALRADESELEGLTRRRFALPGKRPRSTIAWRDEKRTRLLSGGVPFPGWRGRRTREALAAAFAARVARARRRIFAGKWIYGRGISRLSHALIQRLDADLVLERRRQNYLRLDSLLRETSGYDPVLADLSPETCPLYLPIFVPHREEILIKLQAALVETFIFGMFNHPAMDTVRFPESRRMREGILCLPVHQNLDDCDLERIASLLRPLLAR
jgi:perosamine synthetase